MKNLITVLIFVIVGSLGSAVSECGSLGYPRVTIAEIVLLVPLEELQYDTPIPVKVIVENISFTAKYSGKFVATLSSLPEQNFEEAEIACQSPEMNETSGILELQPRQTMPLPVLLFFHACRPGSYQIQVKLETFPDGDSSSIEEQSVLTNSEWKEETDIGFNPDQQEGYSCKEYESFLDCSAFLFNTGNVPFMFPSGILWAADFSSPDGTNHTASIGATMDVPMFPGDWLPFGVAWWITQPGLYEVEFFLDPENLVLEEHEDNNYGKVEVMVE